jgi:hypothetical protein
MRRLQLGPIAEAFGEQLTASGVSLEDVADPIGDVLSVKDASALQTVQKAARLCWFVLSHAYPARRGERRRPTEWQSRLCGPSRSGHALNAHSKLRGGYGG